MFQRQAPAPRKAHPYRQRHQPSEENGPWSRSHAPQATLDAVRWARLRPRLIARGEGDAAAELGERLYDSCPDPDLAFAIACCWGAARQPARALVWLDRAVTMGFRDLEHILRRDELGSVRQLPPFRTVIAPIG